MTCTPLMTLLLSTDHDQHRQGMELAHAIGVDRLPSVEADVVQWYDLMAWVRSAVAIRSTEIPPQMRVSALFSTRPENASAILPNQWNIAASITEGPECPGEVEARIASFYGKSIITVILSGRLDGLYRVTWEGYRVENQPVSYGLDVDPPARIVWQTGGDL